MAQQPGASSEVGGMKTYNFPHKGSSINDVAQFFVIFKHLPSSRFLALRLYYYRHKILDTPPPKGVTSFMDDPSEK
jgi:hypothetical protein